MVDAARTSRYVTSLLSLEQTYAAILSGVFTVFVWETMDSVADTAPTCFRVALSVEFWRSNSERALLLFLVAEASIPRSVCT